MRRKTGLKALLLTLIILELVFAISRRVTAVDSSGSCPKIETASARYGRGGLSTLNQACEALSDGQYHLVGIEDLWATAIKEGRTLFNSKNMWGPTGPAQTKDMLGQTTIGPWQITLANVREYGRPYGIQNEWTDHELISFLQDKPKIQARLAADFIEDSYRTYGTRSPLAIQRYFWLDGFLQKKIGQGPWYNSVLALHPQEMSQTGFYAKQLLLGSRFNPDGLLYWLWISGDEEAIRAALDRWKRDGYPITQKDLKYCGCDPAFKIFLKKMLNP